MSQRITKAFLRDNKFVFDSKPLRTGMNPEVFWLNQILKSGVWLYFFLLLFEGALRKWIFPQLSEPLLIIRDPLAVLLLLLALRADLAIWNIYSVTLFLVGIISIILAMIVGHHNLFVALFGARIVVIHFPMIFLIGRVLNYSDVLKIGKFLVYLSIPMTLLIALQFFSPQTAWVNRGIGGDMEGGGFNGGALGYFRPPGTFSFTTGVACFYGLLACFIAYFWLNTKFINRFLLFLSTMSMLLAIPLSISRTLLFFVVVIFIFVFIIVVTNPKYLSQFILICLMLLCAGLLLGKTTFFDTAADAFSTRFTNASNDEGGLKGTLVNRYLGSLIKPIVSPNNSDFFGLGIGMGTNVGSVILSGEKKFLIAEDEWARLIGEEGLLLGLIIIVVRLVLALRLCFFSIDKLLRGNHLPWLLAGFVLMNLPQAQWAQPNILGFSSLSAGLLVASLINPSDKEL